MTTTHGCPALHFVCDPRPRGGTDAAPFAAYIAHELRTPLATQRALLELALADLDADTDAWREIAREVLEACRQQERLLEACLSLSRSQAGLEGCAIVDLAALAAAQLQTVDLEGLSATVRLEPALTTGDGCLIEQLLDNLLSNAVRHNRTGGWIALSVGRTRTRAVFAIENTGPRISMEEVARLFEPFQQQFPQAAGSAGGLGLGLAVAKAVADAHRARISARARPGGGLRVEVAFALAPPPPDGRRLPRLGPGLPPAGR